MKVLCLSFLFLIITGIARAGDEVSINNALANGGAVHLQSGVYTLENPIYIHSGNVLTGESDTILRVSSSSSQWFKDGTGIITTTDNTLTNVEISGFQIDGNCENLPSSYANSGNGIHNAERSIDFRGDSAKHFTGITIHDCKLYDAFSDGVHTAFCDNVNCYNNFCSNLQHDSIFYIDCIGGSIHDNEVAGITSDCLRLDDCQEIKVYNNLLYSYSGNNNNGAYEHGENGLQAGDESDSSGPKGGSSKPDSTKNIEVWNNTFADNGLQAILLDNVKLGSNANLYIHDNRFIDIEGLNTTGISFENSPTVEESTSIFDLINKALSFSYPDKQIGANAVIQVIYYNNSFNAHLFVYVDGEGLTCVKYEYNGLSTIHYFNINGLDLWTGDLQHRGNAVYLNGSFDASKLQVTCYNSQGYHTFSNFNISEVLDDSAKILSPELWAFIGTLAILGFSIYRNFRRIVTKW